MAEVLETEIPSPCINICRIADDSDVCVGCFRSLAEIGEWSAAPTPRRLEILAAAAARQRQIQPAPSGSGVEGKDCG